MQPWLRTWGTAAIISKNHTRIAENCGPPGAAGFLAHQLCISSFRAEQSHHLQKSSYTLAWRVSQPSTSSTSAGGDPSPNCVLWRALIKSYYLLRVLPNHLIPFSLLLLTPHSTGVQNWLILDLHYFTISKPVILIESRTRLLPEKWLLVTNSWQQKNESIFPSWNNLNCTRYITWLY